MNKKAQIATAMLVVIAIVFSAAALYSIASFKNNFSADSAELNSLVKESDLSVEYVLAQAKELGKILAAECADCTQEQINKIAADFDAAHKTRNEKDGNFFAKLRNGELAFTKSDNTFQLKIENTNIEIKRDYNKITKNFDICQTFSPEGNFLKNCDIQ